MLMIFDFPYIRQSQLELEFIWRMDQIYAYYPLRLVDASVVDMESD